MNRSTLQLMTVAGAVLAIVLIVAAWPAAAEQAEGEEGGRAVFEAQKCGLCHGVPSADIEAKTKSEKMKGPDLLAGEYDLAWLAGYIAQKADKDGEKHPRGFKGSDDELQALVDWLLEQKAEG